MNNNKASKNKVNKKEKPKYPKNYEDMRKIEQTCDIDELIELTRSEDPTVRLRASQQMCPCRVGRDQEDFWNRIFELAEDED